MIGKRSFNGTIQHPALLELQMNALERLTDEQALLFSLCVAERMSHYFSMYASSLSDGKGEIDFTAFRKGLALAWKRFDDIQMAEDLKIKACDTESPLPEPKQSYQSEVGRSSAYYAAHIVFFILEGIKNQETDFISLAKKVSDHATHIMAMISEDRAKSLFSGDAEIQRIPDSGEFLGEIVAQVADTENVMDYGQSMTMAA